MTDGKKVQVYFDERSLKIIEELQVASGSQSMAEVIRDALGLYNWTLRMSRKGYSIGTIKDGKPIKEVILAFNMRELEDE